MTARYPTYEAFWPYYISEHRSPASRALHFVGTGGFLVTVAGCALTAPVPFVPVFTLTLGIGALLFPTESKRPATPALVAMVAIAGAAHPGFLLGVAFAYGCAWTAHFLIEHNRPATFRYPLWSLFSDFRMFAMMTRGQLWTGTGEEEVGAPRPPSDYQDVG